MYVCQMRHQNVPPLGVTKQKNQNRVVNYLVVNLKGRKRGREGGRGREEGGREGGRKGDKKRERESTTYTMKR